MKTPIRILACTLSVLASGCTGIAPRAPLSGTVVSNIHGYTITQSGLQRFAWLHYDAGRVVATGSGPAPVAAARVDGNGQTLLPGLIDAHGHVSGLGRAMALLDLSGTRSLAEARARVSAYIDANPGTDWLLGRGWNQELWSEPRFPTAADLDDLTGGRPAFFRRIDGHAGWANTAAIEAAKINAETVDPPGGQIIRDSAGRSTGVFVDTAMDLVEQQISAVTAAQMRSAILTATARLAELGITAVHDAGISLAEIALYETMAERGELPIRVYSMLGGAPVLDNWDSKPLLRADQMLTIRAVKLYSDGALGSRGALLLADYSDDPGNSGLAITGEDEMTAIIRRARMRGFQANTHAIGDGGNRATLNAYERAGALPDERHRIEHAQVVTLEDIPRFRTLGIIPSMQATHATSDKNMAEKRLGSERLAGAYAWQRFLDQGSRIANGSDFPVEKPNPMLGLYAAVSRRDLEGQPPGGWLPDQKMTRAETLRSFTLDAAHAAFMEETTGSLEPGKWADFILLNGDFFTIAEDRIPLLQVTGTWVAGKKVH